MINATSHTHTHTGCLLAWGCSKKNPGSSKRLHNFVRNALTAAIHTQCFSSGTSFVGGRSIAALRLHRGANQACAPHVSYRYTDRHVHALICARGVWSLYPNHSCIPFGATSSPAGCKRTRRRPLPCCPRRGQQPCQRQGCQCQRHRRQPPAKHPVPASAPGAADTSAAPRTHQGPTQ